MAKTRLTNADRDAIRQAVIAHRFDPLEAAFAREEYALALKVRASVYGDYLAAMEQAPEGAFPTTPNINVSVDGMRVRLRFGASYDVRARIWDKHDHGGSILSTTSARSPAKDVLDWARRCEATKAEKRTLDETVRGTLSPFTTFEGLLDGWPEAATFTQARWRQRGDYSPQLPVASLQKLSAALDLPPEVAEAA